VAPVAAEGDGHGIAPRAAGIHLHGDIAAHGDARGYGEVDVVDAREVGRAAAVENRRLLAGDIEAASAELIVTTDDGSLGRRGNVLQPLLEILEREPVAEVVGAENVVGAICFVGCMRPAPGTVTCSFPGLVMIGEFGRPAAERTRAIAAVFTRAGVKCEAQDNLEELRWRKLVWNVPFNGLAIAAGGITTDLILADEGLKLLARRLMEEIVEAAAKFGHVIPRSFVDLQFERTAKMGAYRPSSLIDYEAGFEVEVEEIWGEPVRRAKTQGAPVPRLEMLYWLIKRLLAARKKVRRVR